MRVTLGRPRRVADPSLRAALLRALGVEDALVAG
jgi:hypothetical protein